MKNLFISTIIFLLFNFSLKAQISEYKILPGDGAEGDWFGHSVSISGDYAIVGAPYDDDDGLNSGSAYIFKRDGSNWTEVQKLLASSGAEGDWFGCSVSISGDYAIVGACKDNDKGNYSGSAYIFKRDGSNWTEVQKLLASDSIEGDNFGYSVSISGDYATIGAPLNDENGFTAGSAYIFKSDSTNWIERQKLLASDSDQQDYFGRSVSISGDFAIVGAYGNDDNGDESGSAYIFKQDGSIWIENQKLLANDGSQHYYFGYSVSISGDYILVGANGGKNDLDLRSGSAYIFKRDGAIWTGYQKLLSSDGAHADYFGISVSISEDFAIVGAYGNDDNGDQSGSAYIFHLEGPVWIEEQKLLASDASASEEFGISVSISGENIIVGARKDNDNGLESGSAYIYTDFVVEVKNDLPENPMSFNLDQNYPNPFNPSTKIKFKISDFGFTTLKVYDVLGKEVVTLLNEEKPAGSYEVEWNASGFPSGVYFYQLKSANFVETKKMILIK